MAGERPPRCRGRSTCSRRRTRSSRRAPIRCPKRSSTGSCSRSTLDFPTPRRGARDILLATTGTSTDLPRRRAGAGSRRRLIAHPEARALHAGRRERWWRRSCGSCAARARATDDATPSGERALAWGPGPPRGPVADARRAGARAPSGPSGALAMSTMCCALAHAAMVHRMALTFAARAKPAATLDNVISALVDDPSRGRGMRPAIAAGPRAGRRRFGRSCVRRTRARSELAQDASSMGVSRSPWTTPTAGRCSLSAASTSSEANGLALEPYWAAPRRGNDLPATRYPRRISGFCMHGRAREDNRRCTGQRCTCDCDRAGLSILDCDNPRYNIDPTGAFPVCIRRPRSAGRLHAGDAGSQGDAQISAGVMVFYTEKLPRMSVRRGEPGAARRRSWAEYGAPSGGCARRGCCTGSAARPWRPECGGCASVSAKNSASGRISS